MQLVQGSFLKMDRVACIWSGPWRAVVKVSAKLPRHILSGHCHSGCHSPKPRLSRAGTPAAPPLAAVPRSVCCMEVAACRWRRAHGLSLSSFVEVWGSRDKGIERMDVIRRTFIGGFFGVFFGSL